MKRPSNNDNPIVADTSIAQSGGGNIFSYQKVIKLSKPTRVMSKKHMIQLDYVPTGQRMDINKGDKPTNPWFHYDLKKKTLLFALGGF